KRSPGSENRALKDQLARQLGAARAASVNPALLTLVEHMSSTGNSTPTSNNTARALENVLSVVACGCGGVGAKPEAIFVPQDHHPLNACGLAALTPANRVGLLPDADDDGDDEQLDEPVAGVDGGELPGCALV